MNFKEYLQEAKYYKQKDIYIHDEGGFPVKILSREEDYPETIITFQDLESGEGFRMNEEEFLSIFRKAEGKIR